MTDGLEPIEPSKALELYLNERQADGASDNTIYSHQSRLGHFVRWCENEGITNLNDLSGRDLHEFRLWRQEDGDLNKVTVKTQLDTLRVFIRFCERIDAVQMDLSTKVQSPVLRKGENERDVMIDSERVEELLKYLTRFHYASRHHAMWSVMWHTGSRSGGVRALDLEDYDREQEWLEVKHRPETDTPLKNKTEGERLIAISPEICTVLDDYIENERKDKTDDYGRNPLFTTKYGRVSRNAVRNAIYKWSRPCEITGECPHDRELDDCEALSSDPYQPWKCPSSVSPHAVRRGAITHHLINDVPTAVVCDRMNVTQRVLERHYDQRTEKQKVETRRGYLDNV